MPSAEKWKLKSPLLKRMREIMRTKHMSIKTEDAYVSWCAQFFAWSDCGSVDCMDGKLAEDFLTHLAVEKKVSAATQNQCFNAILFLFRHVLGKELGEVKAQRAKISRHIPEWLTRDELKKLFGELEKEWLLLARLGYGTGLRLMELLRLRVKDIDFGNGTIFVRDGKGAKDRMVMLPKTLEHDLFIQIAAVDTLHKKDLAAGYGAVYLPGALAKKYPNAPKSIGWQYLFPSREICKSEDGELRRHHLFPNGFQTALKLAGQRAKICKRVHPHILRHSFATHFLENGGGLQMLQTLMGHKDVSTTMIYTHCIDLKRANSPADFLN